MLRDAMVEGHAVPPRVLELKAPSAGENDRDAIPLDHAMLILAAAKGTDDESRWLAAFTQGLRPAEALGLAWDAVDLAAGTLDVSWQLKALPYKVKGDRTSGFRTPVGYEARQVQGAWHRVRPKTAKGQRVLTLAPALAGSLERWQASSGGTGLVWSPKDLRTDVADRQAFYDLQAAAKVKHESGRRYLCYEARHTCATLLQALGYDTDTITRIMGHASILSTKAYLHADQARQRQAAGDLAARLGWALPQIDA
jgi:integrase